jgi:hypothetical protein
MVTGYEYERVLEDREKYQQRTEDGKYLAWWEQYLRDEGFQIEYRPISDLRILPRGAHAILVFQKPLDNAGHVVAVDELGVVDPLDTPTEHESLNSFYEIFKIEGWKFYHNAFLLVRKPHDGEL